MVGSRRDPTSLLSKAPMDTDVLRRLHYAAAIACGVFAALVMHILLTVSGIGLDSVLRDSAIGNKQQFISAMAWWAIGGGALGRGRGCGGYPIGGACPSGLVLWVCPDIPIYGGCLGGAHPR